MGFCPLFEWIAPLVWEGECPEALIYFVFNVKLSNTSCPTVHRGPDEVADIAQMHETRRLFKLMD